MKKAIAILLVLGAVSCGDSPPTQQGRLLDADGNVLLELEIAIAKTEHERQEGLRLHVIYLSAARRVIATERNIPANAPGPYCHPTTQLALELNGGTLSALNYAKLELF